MKRLIAFLIIISISGCATTYRTNRSFAAYFNVPKNIAIMPPDIKIHRLTAGGVRELIDEWTLDAKLKILNSLENELSTFPKLKVSLLNENKLGPSDRDFLKEQRGMFNAVAYSIVAHTYAPASTFKHKVENFDYTLGDEIARLGDLSGSDALLFCSGTNYIWTAGRVGLATFGLLVGVVTGITVVVPPGPEWLVAALVDAKTGNVLWFDYVEMPGDMRQAEVDKAQIKRIFKTFPRS